MKQTTFDVTLFWYPEKTVLIQSGMYSINVYTVYGKKKLHCSINFRPQEVPGDRFQIVKILKGLI